MKRIFGVIVFVLITGLIIYGYTVSNRPLTVSQVHGSQSNYHEQKIEIRGQVGKVFSIKGFGGYTLTDGQNSLGVVFSDGSSPNQNSIVVVRGTFNEAYNLFGKRQGVIVEDTRITKSK